MSASICFDLPIAYARLGRVQKLAGFSPDFTTRTPVDLLFV